MYDTAAQSTTGGTGDDRKALLKTMILRLHDGASPDDVKEEFGALLREIGPTDIARAEEELIDEGLPREEIQRLCDVHLAVFRESVESSDGAGVGHPIDILRTEHDRLLEMTEQLAAAATAVSLGIGDSAARLGGIAQWLRESESHYVREENVLFPYLEKHGIKQPPAIMWMEHDRIRPVKREVAALADACAAEPTQDGARTLATRATQLRDLLESHFHKENNILFPAALEVVEAAEWTEILRQFDELGYPSFSADLRPEPLGPAAATGIAAADGQVALETGTLSLTQLEAILTVLPVELTFVDAEDRVAWFSNQKERIFVRTKAAIGREVAQCHPQKSLHLVEQILVEMKAGARDSAEFWLPVNEQVLHVRFFAVRDPRGAYLGCLEVTQDITGIQKLTGQKRLV